MTKDKALKLALEALEAGDWYINQLEMLVYSIDDDGTHENRAKVQAAITAIKQALAQTEQEPVGTVGSLFDENVILRRRLDRDLLVYTTPPAAQRTWVGLSDEQFVEAARLAEAGNYLVAFQRIQQWIKEKNT
jgi:UDP-N-acetylenolpyruvoylglucosamine reductase